MENIEVWKDILGYEGCYQISNIGNIKSLKRTVLYSKVGLKNIKERILKKRIQNSGYLIVDLRLLNKVKTFTIHRIVAEYFVPNLNNKPCVNHIDGNKLNNNYYNLEWNTYSENNNHAINTGLRKINCIVQKDKNDVIINRFNSIKEACLVTGISMPSISRSTSGIRLITKGFKFYKI